MTVGASSVSTIKPGRVEDAIALSQKWGKVVTAAGGQNYRTVLLINATPIRLVQSYEAADQTALGKVTDTFMADPDALAVMNESGQKDSPIAGYISDTWIEV